MTESRIRYVTEAELQAKIDTILAKYPWFVDYPVSCHAKCARWEIADEHGYDAGDAWQEYDSALFLLDGSQPGKAARDV